MLLHSLRSVTFETGPSNRQESSVRTFSFFSRSSSAMAQLLGSIDSFAERLDSIAVGQSDIVLFRDNLLAMLLMIEALRAC